MMCPNNRFTVYSSSRSILCSVTIHANHEGTFDKVRRVGNALRPRQPGRAQRMLYFRAILFREFTN